MRRVCIGSGFQPAVSADVVLDDQDILVVPVALSKEEVVEMDDFRSASSHGVL